MAEIEALRQDGSRLAADNAALRAELAQAMKERARAIAVGDDMEQEVEQLRERVRALEDALRKAADDMEGWGLYAPEYFREKHDFVGDVAAARAALGDKT